MMCESDETIHVVASSSATVLVGAVIVMGGLLGGAQFPTSPVRVCHYCRRVPERYDTIGRVYARHRAADPRIAAQIEAALGDARSVVNVGAGAGSYEPRDRVVAAVEPSTVMIAQRPSDAAPVVRAVAEALPFARDAFDVALATFTVHHWTDPAAGLRELERVAPRQVILTFDESGEWLDRFWLTRDYLPRSAFADTVLDGVTQVCDVVSPARIEVVPVPFDCRDGFFCAYWRDPHAYLDPGVRASISALALLEEAVLLPGLARLAADLESGAWEARNADILELEALDLGYRLVVT
jgi:SAM-dependent methyltransferase